MLDANKKENDSSSSSSSSLEEDVFIVSGILEHKMNEKRNKITYLVSWENYGPDDNTWEPEENLKHLDLFKEYIKEHGKTIREMEERILLKMAKAAKNKEDSKVSEQRGRGLPQKQSISTKSAKKKLFGADIRKSGAKRSEPKKKSTGSSTESDFTVDLSDSDEDDDRIPTKKKAPAKSPKSPAATSIDTSKRSAKAKSPRTEERARFDKQKRHKLSSSAKTSVTNEDVENEARHKRSESAKSPISVAKAVTSALADKERIKRKYMRKDVRAEPTVIPANYAPEGISLFDDPSMDPPVSSVVLAIKQNYVAIEHDYSYGQSGVALQFGNTQLPRDGDEMPEPILEEDTMQVRLVHIDEEEAEQYTVEKSGQITLLRVVSGTNAIESAIFGEQDECVEAWALAEKRSNGEGVSTELQSMAVDDPPKVVHTIPFSMEVDEATNNLEKEILTAAVEIESDVDQEEEDDTQSDDSHVEEGKIVSIKKEKASTKTVEKDLGAQSVVNKEEDTVIPVSTQNPPCSSDLDDMDTLKLLCARWSKEISPEERVLPLSVLGPTKVAPLDGIAGAHRLKIPLRFHRLEHHQQLLQILHAPYPVGYLLYIFVAKRQGAKKNFTFASATIDLEKGPGDVLISPPRVYSQMKQQKIRSRFQLNPVARTENSCWVWHIPTDAIRSDEEYMLELSLDFTGRQKVLNDFFLLVQPMIVSFGDHRRRSARKNEETEMKKKKET